MHVFHAMGFPVVASDIPVYRAWIREGQDGFLAKDRQHWLDAITVLAEDWRLRATMGCSGGERAWCECAAKVVAQEWLDSYGVFCE